MGRAGHLAHTQRRPLPASSVRPLVPIAYVLVPPAASAKALASEFARYLGIPVTARMTQARITDAACHTYNRVGVRLVVIDEMHRLNPRTTTGADQITTERTASRCSPASCWKPGADARAALSPSTLRTSRRTTGIHSPERRSHLRPARRTPTTPGPPGRGSLWRSQGLLATAPLLPGSWCRPASRSDPIG
ncbi:TniB family NTP-binding protein [Streptomyces sp. NPDC087538]|uniref:TniB family NTP-binding protein n=1 Tax=Streptomyces sp. NPDC087538 TaxID=3365797 RepID=UPI0038179EBE